jgi:dihydrofolate reductase
VITLLAEIDAKRVLSKRGVGRSFFRVFTTGKTIIVGRRTLELAGSFPHRNVICCTSKQIGYEGSCKSFMTTNNVEAVINVMHALNEEAFVVGGSKIFNAALKSVRLTRVILCQLKTTVDEIAETLPDFGFSVETVIMENDVCKFVEYIL